MVRSGEVKLVATKERPNYAPDKDEETEDPKALLELKKFTETAKKDQF